MKYRIKACLFDLDGLLINSEDIYTEIVSETLASYGKGPLTWDIKIQLQGVPGPQAARTVIDHYDLPITPNQYIEQNANANGKWERTRFLPGALELLKYLKSKNIPMALCSSSDAVKLKAKTAHLREGFDLFDAFITGDDPRLPPGRGKPFPDVWYIGLNALNEKYNRDIQPDECLVFEDAVAGVQAGKAFGGHVIWVPHPQAFEYLDDTAAVLGEKGELLTSLEHLDKSKYGL